MSNMRLYEGDFAIGSGVQTNLEDQLEEQIATKEEQNREVEQLMRRMS